MHREYGRWFLELGKSSRIRMRNDTVLPIMKLYFRFHKDLCFDSNQNIRDIII